MKKNTTSQANVVALNRGKQATVSSAKQANAAARYSLGTDVLYRSIVLYKKSGSSINTEELDYAISKRILNPSVIKVLSHGNFEHRDLLSRIIFQMLGNHNYRDLETTDKIIEKFLSESLHVPVGSDVYMDIAKEVSTYVQPEQILLDIEEAQFINDFIQEKEVVYDQLHNDFVYVISKIIEQTLANLSGNGDATNYNYVTKKSTHILVKCVVEAFIATSKDYNIYVKNCLLLNKMDEDFIADCAANGANLYQNSINSDIHLYEAGLRERESWLNKREEKINEKEEYVDNLITELQEKQKELIDMERVIQGQKLKLAIEKENLDKILFDLKNAYSSFFKGADVFGSINSSGE